MVSSTQVPASVAVPPTATAGIFRDENVANVLPFELALISGRDGSFFLPYYVSCRTIARSAMCG